MYLIFVKKFVWKTELIENTCIIKSNTILCRHNYEEDPCAGTPASGAFSFMLVWKIYDNDRLEK